MAGSDRYKVSDGEYRAMRQLTARRNITKASTASNYKGQHLGWDEYSAVAGTPREPTGREMIDEAQKLYNAGVINTAEMTERMRKAIMKADYR